jgi:hypothetical protein
VIVLLAVENFTQDDPLYPTASDSRNAGEHRSRHRNPLFLPKAAFRHHNDGQRQIESRLYEADRVRLMDAIASVISMAHPGR